MDLFSLQSFLVFAVFFLYLYFHNSTPIKKPLNRGFKHYPVVGSLPELIKNGHRFLDWTTQVLRQCPTNTSVLHRPGNVHGVITANPLNVEHILKTNFENYPKGDQFNAHLEDLLGRGIFNSDGELWKLQRKTASYEFNTKSLRNFVLDNLRYEMLTRLLPILTEASEAEQVLDLQDILERFAFDNVCKLAFNTDPGCLGGNGTSGSEFMRAFEEAATISSGRFMYLFTSIWKLKRFFNLGSEKSLKQSIAVVHGYASEIIRSRLLQASADNPDEDILSRFIANKENSPEFLRDIVISFILAGRDTTSSALTWFFWLLSRNPDVEQNILNELQTIRARNRKVIGDTYSFEELRDMHYLQAALSEALRMYPPVPVDTKACLNDDILPDGTFIGKGWFITYNSYAMGRMEKIWGENYNQFLPERWLEDGIYRHESPSRFPAFHAGPRTCLGKDMAYIQMKSIAASVIESFVIDVQNKDTCPEHVLSLTLRMKDGLHVRVRRRPGQYM